MRIPAHLTGNTRWRGMPVPFINIWSDEADEEAWEIRPDPLVNGLALFTPGRPGVGVPDFTKQAPQRQRLCMVEGLCQVCRVKVPHRPRTLILSGISAKHIEVEGMPGEQLAISEPWLCRRCVPFVLRYCPGLRRRAADLGDVTVIEVDSWTLTTTVAWHESHGIDNPAVSFIDILPGRTRVVEVVTPRVTCPRD